MTGSSAGHKRLQLPLNSEQCPLTGSWQTAASFVCYWPRNRSPSSCIHAVWVQPQLVSLILVHPWSAPQHLELELLRLSCCEVTQLCRSVWTPPLSSTQLFGLCLFNINTHTKKRFTWVHSVLTGRQAWQLPSLMYVQDLTWIKFQGCLFLSGRAKLNI